MKPQNISILLILFIAILFGCKKEDPPNPVEFITTLNFTLIPEGGGPPIVLSHKDLDGPGGDPPIVIGATLDSTSSYSASIELLDESVSPVKNLTAEIKNEAEDHQFFFEVVAGILSLGIFDMDEDANGNPLGLVSTARTGSPGAGGTFRITLIHKPEKSFFTVLANAGGETDIVANFDIVVQ